MAVTKEDWKDVGRGFKGAFKSLGKSVVKSVKTGVDKAADWAEVNDGNAKPAEASAEEKPAEENKAE